MGEGAGRGEIVVAGIIGTTYLGVVVTELISCAIADETLSHHSRGDPVIALSIPLDGSTDSTTGCGCR